MLVGTVFYLPEQALGQTVDGRADQTRCVMPYERRPAAVRRRRPGVMIPQHLYLRRFRLGLSP
jgi:hypothetical protein